MSSSTRKGIYSRSRRSEFGNVFFTLFGAVAVVGVLGAGIMATMRGPLSTMVEVNRREQAKAELRVAASLILVNASDDFVEITCEGGTAGVDEDGYTEGPQPVAGGGPTGGGLMPAVGAAQNDPWGNSYGYCAWDHGPLAADYDAACARYLAGNVSTNNVAIAVLSAGPDGTYQTTCADDAGGYVNPDSGGGDDIVVTMTYDQAISGSGGLWNLNAGDPNLAEINKDISVAQDAAIGGTLDVTGTSSFQDVLAANAGMMLPTDDTVGFGDADCAAGNNLIMRVNDDPTPPILEICDGANTSWEPAGSAWSLNGSDLFYNGGNVGIGLNNPNDALDVVGSAQITGAVDLDNNLDVAGTSTLGGTLTVNAVANLNGDVVITGDATGGGTDALTVRDSSNSVIFTVQNDSMVGINNASPNDQLDVNGAIDTTDFFKIDNAIFLNGDSTIPGTILLGESAGANVTGDDNIIVGGQSANTLTSGTGNIVIGSGLDVPSATGATTADYLNIGDLVVGDIANSRLGVGFPTDTDVSTFNDTLEVNGSTDIAGTLNVTSTSTFGNNVTITGDTDDGSTEPLTIEDSNNTTVAEIDSNGNADFSGSVEAADYTYNGNDFTPGSCAAGSFNRWTGSAWVCEVDGAGAGGGTQDLDSVLTNGNDAGGSDIVNLADPTNAQDAATKAYVDSQVGGLSQDRIEDTGDQNTYIDVDTANDDSLNTISMATAGTERMLISSTGNFTLTGATSSLDINLGNTDPLLTSSSNELRIDDNLEIRSGNSLNLYNAANGSAGSLTFNTSDLVLSTLTGDIALMPNASVGIGTAAPNTSSALDITSTTQGMLAPRMTIAQRDAIGTPATGLLVFATDAGTNGIFQFYDGSAWVDVGAGGASGAGIWQEDGTNDYIEYDDTLGGVRIGRVTGQPAPETDWNLDVANSWVYRTGDVALGSSTVSGALVLDVTGDVGATQYCDADGNNCFTAATVAGGGGNTALHNITAATAGNTINNAAWNQAWQWQLTGAGSGMAFSESAASTGGASNQAIVDISTLASSTAIPLYISNYGNGHSLLVADQSSDTTPFVIDASGNVGIGIAAPTSILHTVDGDITIGDTADVARKLFLQRNGAMVGKVSTDNGDMSIEAMNGNDVRIVPDGGISDGGIVVLDNGNVGIGTLSANEILTVSSANSDIDVISFANQSDIQLKMANGSEGSEAIVADTEVVGSIRYGGYDSAKYIHTIQMYGVVNGTPGVDDVPLDLVIGMDPAGTPWDAGDEMFRISSGGDITMSGTGALQFHSGTDAQRPTGADGMIRFNTDNDAYEVYSTTAADWIEIVSAGAIAGGVAGNDTEVQFNDGGSPGADAGLTYNKTTDTLTIGTALNVGETITITGQAGNAPTFAALNDLSDTAVAGASDGDLLYYNNTSGNWEAIDPASAGAGLWTDNTTYISRTGNVVVDGTHGAGDTLSPSGAGSRMFFYPRKSAFRAGQVVGTEWDDANIGDRSVGLGAQAIASGDTAIAMGYQPQAAGTNSFALGFQAETGAAATASVALGQKVNVTGAASMGIGLGLAVGVSPIVSGANSLGIFLGDQNGADVTAANTVAILGGGLVVGDTTALPTLSGNQSYQFYTDASVTNSGDLALGATANSANRRPDLEFFRARSTPGSETVVQDGDAIGGIRFTGYDGDSWENRARITGFVNGTVADGDVPMDIVFDTGDTAISERMRIGSGGNIGIGDFSADVIDSALHLQAGDIRLDGGAANEAGCIRFNDATDLLQFSHDCASAWTNFGGATPGAIALDDLADAATTVADNNMFIGHEGGSYGANDLFNLGVGYGALDSLINSATVNAGDLNTAIGHNAMTANTTGDQNVAVGTAALSSNVSGRRNTAIGRNALQDSTGNDNAALGRSTLGQVTGAQNTGLGTYAGRGLAASSDVSNNVFVGYNAGVGVLTGADNNTIVGHNAAATLTTGASNIIIGKDADVTGATASNELNIGGLIFGDLANRRMALGTTDPSTPDSTTFPALKIVGESASSTAADLLLMQFNNAPTSKPDVAMYRARGTAESGALKVEDDDVVGNLRFRAHDGVDWNDAGGIQVEVDGATASNDVPTRMLFSTSGGSGGNEIMRLTSDQKVLIGTTDASDGVGFSDPGFKYVKSGGNDDIWIISHNNNPSTKTDMVFMRSRGTESSPTAVADGDFISQTRWAGYDGDSWEKRAEISVVVNGAVADGVIPTDMIFETGTSSDVERMRIDSSGGVGINTGAANDASAIFQVDSTTRGLLIPRMNTTQRDNISSPATGLQVYNTTTNTLDYYNGSAWVSFATSSGSVPDDSLDWDKFVDAMTLDATTTIDMDTNTADLNFDSGTFFIESTNNRIGIGTPNPGSILHLTADNQDPIFESTHGTFNWALDMTYRRSNAGGLAPGGRIAGNRYEVHDGVTYRRAAELNIVADGTPAAGSTPGRFDFLTTPSGSTTAVERMRITSDGDIGIGTQAPESMLNLSDSVAMAPEIRFSDTDITQPSYSASASFDTYSGTDTFGSIRQRGNAGDGLEITGLSGDGVNGVNPLTLIGAHGGTAPTVAAVEIAGQKWGGNNRAALTGSEPLLDIKTTAYGNGVLMRVQGDGNVGIGDFSSDTIDSTLHLASGDIRVDGGAGNEAGCIRFDDTTDKLRFSHDCTTFTDMGGAAGAIAINDLTDAEKDTTNNNLFMGEVYGSALANNQGNLSLGIGALDALTNSVGAGEGDSNIAIGWDTLSNLTTGSSNVAMGVDAGINTTIATDNVMIGTGAGSGVVDGIQNVLVGTSAGSALNDGGFNTAVGYLALTNAATGSNSNVAIGIQAGEAAASANIDGNVFVGAQAGQNVNTGADNNVMVGGGAGTATTTGHSNTFVGSVAGISNTDGEDNTYIGRLSGNDSTTSSENTAVGLAALENFDNTDVNSRNVALGYRAMDGVDGSSTGVRNTALGALAGNSITTGTDNILLGYDVDVPTPTTSNHLNIGDAIYGDLSTKEIYVGDMSSSTIAGMNTGIEIIGDGSDRDLAIHAYGAGSTPDLEFVHAEGPNYAGIAVNDSGDDLGRIRVSSYDGSKIIRGLSDISFEVSGTPAADDIPVDIVFNTGDGSGGNFTPTERMRITSGGNAGFGDFSSDTIDSAIHLQTGDIRLDGGAANQAGCIRFDDTTDKIQFSHDCTTFSDMGGAAGAIAINDLTDGITTYATTENIFMGNNIGGSYGATDTNNIGLGTDIFANLNNSGATFNSAFGASSLETITSGDENAAFGYSSLNALNSGSNNAALGASAAYKTTTGNENTALGFDTLSNNTIGDNNVAIGSSALGNPAAADGDMDDNVAVGRRAGFSVAGGAAGAGGNQNVLLGANAGANVTTGDGNIVIGYDSGSSSISTGSNNILIGYDVETSADPASNEINIGDMIYGDMVNGRLGVNTAADDRILHLHDPDTGVWSSGDLQLTSNGSGSGVGDGVRLGYTDGNGSPYGFFTVAENAPLRIDTNDTERMRIDENGNVGIGETAPLTNLHVLGADQSATTSHFAGSSAVVIEDGDAAISLVSSESGSDGSMIEFNEVDTGALVDKWSLVRRTTNGTGDSSIVFRFGTDNNNWSHPEILHLASNGDVGIGNFASDSVDSSLHIREGAIRLDGGAGNEAGCVRFDDTTDKMQFAHDCSTWSDMGSGGGTPGGADTHVQYNNAGAFGGEAAFAYDDSKDTLTVVTLSATDRISLTPKTSIGTPNGLAIDDLSDVDVSGVTDTQVLTYNSTSGNWEASNAGGGAIDDLSDALKNTTDNNLFMAHEGGSVGANNIQNTGIGISALDSLTNGAGGDNNTALGYNALTAITTGGENTGIGSNVGTSITTGDGNTYIGKNSGRGPAGDRGYNVAVGRDAFDAGTGGSKATDYSVAIGNGAGDDAETTGSIYVGNSAGAASDGDHQVNLGFRAGQEADGNNNIFIGYSTGSGAAGNSTAATTGADNILIGYDLELPTASTDDHLNIGNLIYGDLANNEVFIDVPAAAPPDGDLANGQVSFWVDAVNDELEFKAKDSAGDIITATLGAAGSVGGADTQVLFNNAGTEDGDAGMTYSAASDTLNINSTVNVGDLVNIGTTTGAAAPTGATNVATLNLDDLGDVDTTGFADGEVLTYNSTSGNWESAAAAGGGLWTDNANTINYQNVHIWKTGTTLAGVGTSTPTMYLDGDTANLYIGEDPNSKWVQNANTGNSLILGLDHDTDAMYSSIVVGAYNNVDSVNGSGNIIAGLTNTLDNNSGSMLVSGQDHQISYANNGIVVGVDNEVYGNQNFIFGREVIGNYSVRTAIFSLGDHTGSKPSINSNADDSFVVLLGDQGGATFDTAERFAVLGGEMLLDGDPTTGSTGCIRYNDTSDKIEISHNCSSYSELEPGLWTDSGSGYIEYTSTLGGAKIASISGVAAPTGAVVSSAGSSLWTAGTGDDIYYNTGTTPQVGIGNAAPSYLLDVGVSTEIQLALNDDTTATVDPYSMNLDNTNGNRRLEVTSQQNTQQQAMVFSDVGAAGTGTMFGLSSSSNSGSTWNPRLIVTQDGEIGINTNTPSVALDVSGDIEYTGTITDVSDRRLKDNIEPLSKYGSLIEKIDAVDTYSFTMKDDEKDRTEFGVMAQELEKIFPELVHTADDEMGTKSVNYVGLIAPMIEATKELKAENETLRTELAEMNAEKAEIHAAVSDLSKQVELLNKVAGNNVNKASTEHWLYMLLGLFAGLSIVLVFTRRKTN